MDRGKKINVSAATIVDLKAELFRKQDELKRNKQNKPSFVIQPSLKIGRVARQEPDKLGKSNPGLEGRIARDKERHLVENEDVDALAASRKKLEEKSKLYDKLSSGKDLPETEDTYMVDFSRKIYLDVPSSNNMQEPEDDLPAPDESEEWVDYTDSLGRSRRCLKKDLSKMVEMDLDLQNRNKPQESPTREEQEGEREEGFEEDDYEEEQEAEPGFIGPLHYQNERFSEVRTHGVGYYAFSQAEEERKAQLDALNELRNRTMEQRLRSEKIKEKRKAALEARLKKVKQRKKLQSGGVLSDSSDSESEKVNELKEEEAAAAAQIPEKITEVEKEVPKPTIVRPWDKGKVDVRRVAQPFRKASQQDWIERQRQERVAEFAPPQAYQNDPVEHMHAFFRMQAQSMRRETNPSTYPPQPSPIDLSDINLPPD